MTTIEPDHCLRCGSPMHVDCSGDFHRDRLNASLLAVERTPAEEPPTGETQDHPTPQHAGDGASSPPSPALLSPECTCGHPYVWHNTHLTGCEFHCGNTERCPCTGFQEATRGVQSQGLRDAKGEPL